MVDKLIGIDVGTTAVKAVLIDLAGTCLARFSRSYPVLRPTPGAAEQDPAAWMDAIVAALTAFAASHDLSGLAGIGICSQVNTHVFVDRFGAPVLPAMTWQDSRPAPDAKIIDAQVTPAQKLAWFGGPVPIDASHALSRIAYVARTTPEAFARTAHVLLPKDFCVLALTGAVASDPIAAVGLVDRAGYVGPLLDLVPGARDLLPPLFGFTHVAGRVRPGLACAGTPVVVGAMDAWGGMFGLGVARNGEAMLQSGTSEIAGIVSANVCPTPGVVLFPPYDGITMHAAPTQSGGAALAWFAGVLGTSPAELAARAAGVDPSPALPLFLPHLQGERAPLWDTASRGVFARLDGRAGAPEMAHAVMEGVGFSVRWAFAALERSTGCKLEGANIGGGGAASDIWTQIKADILGYPLKRAVIRDSAAVGAAMLAGIGSGTMGSLGEAIDAMVRFDKTFDPRPRYQALYEDRFARYQELYTTLQPFNAAFGTPDRHGS